MYANSRIVECQLEQHIFQLVRIIMSDSRNLDDNNWQQSMLFFLFTIGYCIGPVIGGALTTITFRWIFAIK